MDPNTVSEDYVQLQLEIIDVQAKVRENVQENFQLQIDSDDINKDVAILPQLQKSPIRTQYYKEALRAVAETIHNETTDLTHLMNIISQLTDENIVKWIKAAITFDTQFFENVSEQNDVAQWVPHFIAEQAIRPFLHIVSEACKSFINDMDVMGTCPCCGEPPRIAEMEKDGDKKLICPRCETVYDLKKHACVHCGEDREGKLFYISVEEEDASMVEVCKTCRNYLKLIAPDEDEKSKKVVAAMVDIETLYLDFIAQEEGYGDDR
ncbi:formate dehydrogenase accessory protein FdhE [Evansella cellulosilytica]|uniref:Formate dehydrogenase accessory protein n=1 Tax=Evansella cellulosilytica (strain ATCC 21833 / DSM 2522 / FERM P-1141 / JCM 9156 / N-4) TaxID=649639 RepID=E6U1S6_EVAC2|nr:formate dehydrogenase accessory protein FdhE [Evansella cellulosilytica]ADU31573.1 formate dehydrogenase accessory protein [Evansella cellulosilytica DSM 2522]